MEDLNEHIGQIEAQKLVEMRKQRPILLIVAIATSISAAISLGGLVVALQAAHKAGKVSSCIEKGMGANHCAKYWGRY